MPVGEPLDVLDRQRYIIEIDGVRRAGFQTASELVAEIATVEYREGGRQIPHKRPGKQTFPNLTLARGVTLDTDLYDWFNETANVSTGRALADGRYKRNLDVVMLDVDGSEAGRWTIYGAFPVRFKAGEWDADSDDPQVEEVELAYDYFEKTA